MSDESGSEHQSARLRWRARRNELRGEFEQQVANAKDQLEHARDQFEEANEKIKQRTGRDLILATIIGVAFAAVLILSLVFWKWIFIALVAVVVLVGTLELSRAFRESGRRIDVIAQLLAAAGIVAAAALADLWVLWLSLLGACALIVGWRLAANAFEMEKRASKDLLQDVIYGAFIPAYVAFLASLTIVIVRLDGGQWWVLAFVFVVIAADTGAYAFGLMFGKHPMAPKISPKKTWEGFGGAVLLSLAFGIGLAIFMLDLPWWAGVIFGALILGTATLGDLAESMIKRDLGVKDISSWLPGHGGMLDRLDSILPSAAMALLLAHVLPLIIEAV